MVRRTRAAVVTLVALAATSCSSGRVATPALPEPTASPTPTATAVAKGVASSTPTPKPSPARVRPRPVPTSLVSYGDCRQLLRGIRREALSEVTAYGLNGPFPLVGVGVAMPASGGASGGGSTGGGAAGGPAPQPAGAAPNYSTTNNQEAGVDEPDLVKTDGRLMVVARAYPAVLEVFDVSGSRPVHRARLSLTTESAARLLLVGRSVIVLGGTYGQNRAQTSATVVSLEDPRHPRVVRTFRADGSLLDARLVHRRVLLVTQSWPNLPFVYPTAESPAARRKALLTNRRLVQRATTRDLLPSVTVTPGGGRYATACGNTLHPGVDSGVGTTSVISLDPASAQPSQSVAIVGSSSVVYASTSALYLATTSWRSQEAVWQGRADNVSTDLHGFDVADPDHVRYLGTGSVPGSLTDQYSLSEHNGFLRVATTIGVSPARAAMAPSSSRRPAAVALSDNRVTVLQPVDGALVTVGQVKGLGRGERIYGVRFLGDIGYVVTFRQVDPLYVLDLSDPRAPRTRSELKVTGYSSALYPLGNGQLLGIGQAADPQGHVLGTQVSVFDVRQLARPRLQGKVTLKDSWSLAQDDHHSLLWWTPNRLLVLPLSTYSYTDGTSFNGSVAYRVGPHGSLHELGRVHPPTQGPNECCGGTGVVRTLVVGEVLYSVTDTGLVTNKIGRIDQQAWLPFG